MKHFTLLCLLGFGLQACISPQKASIDKNTTQSTKGSTLVLTTPLKAKYLLFNDSVRVYVNTISEFPETSFEVQNKYVVKYAVKTDVNKIEKVEKRTIALNEEAIFCDGKSIQFHFDLATKPFNGAFGLEIYVEQGKNVSSIDMLVNPLSTATTDHFGFFHNNRFVGEGYSDTADTLQIKSLDNRSQDFTMIKYSHDFDPANSPTLIGNRAPTKQLFVDSLFNTSSNKNLVLQPNAMYVVLKDTLDRGGFCHLKENKRYPRYTLPDQLYQPLKYICTTNEYGQLLKASNKKEAMDAFWLANADNGPLNSQKSIATYYQRVYESNSLFGSYKQGWKTDKGMVYIIMGKPNSITHKKNKEIWIYTQNKDYAEVNFTFNLKPNQFNKEHYELSRYNEFGNIWFPKVSKIRNGSAE
jgi:GWxTD domain-containing protein